MEYLTAVQTNELGLHVSTQTNLKNIMFSGKSKLQMSSVQYILTKSKNMHTVLHTAYECLCSRSIKTCTGMINTRLRKEVPSGGNGKGERDRNASWRGPQGDVTKLVMCSFFKKQSENKSRSNYQQNIKIWLRWVHGVCFGTFYILKSEKAMAPHSGTPAWKIPWMEETGRLQSWGR